MGHSYNQSQAAPPLRMIEYELRPFARNGPVDLRPSACAKARRRAEEKRREGEAANESRGRAKPQIAKKGNLIPLMITETMQVFTWRNSTCPVRTLKVDTKGDGFTLTLIRSYPT